MSRQDVLKKKAKTAQEATTPAEDILNDIGGNDDGGDDPEKKVARTFWVTPSVYEKLLLLAKVRAAAGGKDSRGRPTSAGSLIDTAIAEFVSFHQDELDQWEQFAATFKMK